MSAPDRIGTPYADATAPPHDAPLFGSPGQAPAAHEAVPAEPWAVGVDYAAIHDSPAFQELRRRTLRFTVPATVLFMANFMLFVLLSAYAPGLMGTPVIGLINAGFLLGVFQFLTTVTIVGLYGRFARLHTDPMVDRIRDGAEGP